MIQINSRFTLAWLLAGIIAPLLALFMVWVGLKPHVVFSPFSPVGVLLLIAAYQCARGAWEALRRPRYRTRRGSL